MLWLASLVGIVGAGAASIAVFPSQEEEQEEDELDNQDEVFDGRNDLFEQIEGIDQQAQLSEGEFAQDAISTAPDAGADDDEYADLYAYLDEDFPPDDTDDAFAQQSETVPSGIAVAPMTPFQMDEMRTDDHNTSANAQDGLTADPHFPPNEVTSEPLSGSALLEDIARDPQAPGPIEAREGVYLNGAGEQDVLILGENEQVSGDGENTQINLGDWILEGSTAEVLDYEAGKESLMLVWDDLASDPEEPSVDVASDPYDDEVMHVLMNGRSVAEVYGDPELSIADITLIPLSSALIVGLEPA